MALEAVHDLGGALLVLLAHHDHRLLLRGDRGHGVAQGEGHGSTHLHPRPSSQVFLPTNTVSKYIPLGFP